MMPVRLMAVGALLVFAGCNRSPFELAPVTGKVTLRGRPVTQGTVTFRPRKGQMATGKLGPDGVYTLMTYEPGDGAIVGPAEIAIAEPRHGAPAPGWTPPPPPPPEETIPEKFRNFGTSGLERTVVPGQNVFDFELSEL